MVKELNGIEWNLIELQKNSIVSIENEILNYINLIPADDSELTSEDYKNILKNYILSLFFPDLMKTRPILIFIGDKGSGKSFALKVIQYILIGKHSLTTIKNESDFNAIISNSYLTYIDNIDESNSLKSGTLDMIASVSTGYTIQERKLYKNNEKYELSVDTWLGFTSRTNIMNRVDIAERGLIFKLKRLKDISNDYQYFCEDVVIKTLLQKRDYILSVILNELNLTIKTLKNFSYITKAKFRMADFASFILTISQGKEININGENISLLDYINSIFEKLTFQQSDFIKEDDCFIEVFQDYINENNEFSGKTKELFDCIKNYVENKKEGDSKLYKFLDSPNSFGMFLKKRITIIKDEYEYKETKSGNIKYFSIKKRNI